MRTTLSVALCCFLILGSSSCFTKYHGYGVILWAPEESEYANGEVVDILSESKLNEAYVLRKKESKEEIMIPLWRVEFFSDRDDAEAYAAEYAPYREMYVFSRQEGIPPVREAVGTSDQIRIVYKFRENQVAKVLGRTEEKHVIGNMEDYWYHVLIKNDVPVGGGKYVTVGIKGYCYGYSLELTTAPPGEKVVIHEEQQSGSTDALEKLCAGNWRPLAYQDMISARKINLDQFNPEWGLFLNQEIRQVSIILEQIRYITDYREIVQIKDNTYAFPDSNLTIEIISPERISATFVVDGRQHNLYFVNIQADLGEVITGEKERRDALYTDLLAHGPVLFSSAYGTITLQEKNRMEWSGLGNLIPMIVPRRISGAGNLYFKYFLGPALRSRYDGVLTFSFDDYAPEEGVNFLYQYTNDGIKLFFVDNTNLEGNEIRREGNNQVIIVFTFRES